MRWIAIAALALGSAPTSALAQKAPAEADRVRVTLVTAPGLRADLADALRVEADARSLDLEVVELMDAEHTTGRALAQRPDVAAVVWIEAPNDTDSAIVWAVGAEGEPCYAALPDSLRAISPRVFGLIAASIVDEALAPPVPVEESVLVQIDIDVPVTIVPAVAPAPVPAPAPRAEPAPLSPLSHTDAIAPVGAPGVDRTGRWTTSNGVFTAPAAVGSQHTLARYVTDTLRAGLTGRVVFLTPIDPVYTLGFEVARDRSSGSSERHYGAQAARVWLTGDPDRNYSGWMAGVFYGWGRSFWRDGVSIDLRLGVDAGVIDGDAFASPSAVVSLELPLN